VRPGGFTPREADLEIAGGCLALGAMAVLWVVVNGVLFTLVGFLLAFIVESFWGYVVDFRAMAGAAFLVYWALNILTRPFLK